MDQVMICAPSTNLIVAAGLGQLAIVLASIAIPRALHWREDLAALRPLTRQVFWTYAGYISTTNSGNSPTAGRS